MKKIVFIAAVASVFVLASCGRLDEGKEKSSPVFYATIVGTESKTTINPAIGKVAWKMTDEITISDSEGQNSQYSIQEILKNGQAVFVKKSGQPDLGDGPYTATYGIPPRTEQSYSQDVEDLYMVASSTDGTNLKFSVDCGLLVLRLQKTGEIVKGITVTGTPDGQSRTSNYKLVIKKDVSLDDTTNFYIALPKGTYTQYYFVGDRSRTCYLTDTAGTQVEKGHITTIKFSSKLEFDFNFSVSDTKRVRFTKGNLYWDGSKWQMENNQYDYRTREGKNACINGVISTDGTPAGHVGLLYWAQKAENSYCKDCVETVIKSTDVSFLAESKGLTIDGRKLYMLSFPEAYYLVRRGSKYFRTSVTVGGNRCNVIAPDGFTGSILPSYDTTAWNKVSLNYGLVCMPCTESITSTDTHVVYLSSTANDADDKCPKGYTDSFPNSPSTCFSIAPDYACAVRLVYNTK